MGSNAPSPQSSINRRSAMAAGPEAAIYLQLDSTEQQIVGPLIGVVVLTKDRRDLAPVPDVVQKDIRCDLLLARRSEEHTSELQSH